MIPNAWGGFDFGLGSDFDALRYSVHELARTGLRRAPTRATRQHLSARLVGRRWAALGGSALPWRRNLEGPGSDNPPLRRP